MSTKRADLIHLIDSSLSSPPLSYWNSLLSFFEYNQQTLDLHDLEILCTESERCRLYWNTDRTITVEIRRAGTIVKQDNVIHGLNIDKDDVSPKIYKHLEQLRYEAEIEEDQEKQKVTTSEPSPVAIPMAASSK